MSTKACWRCGSTTLALIGTHQLKICNDCGTKIHWPLDKGQQPLITNNRDKDRSHNMTSRMDIVGQNGNDGLAYAGPTDGKRPNALTPDGSFWNESVKQDRYKDTKGEDWIDEFARTTTVEEFRGAMKFTIGKYNRRVGKKDEIIKEVQKMKDYCQRWEQYEKGVSHD